MYSTTGLPTGAMRALDELIADRFPDLDRPGGRPPVLTWRQEVTISITYTRRNRTQGQLAEDHGVSQVTISRVIARWRPRLGEVLDEFVPTIEDLDPAGQVIVDGTLSPCWDWRDEEGLFSGKHRQTGVNLQVVADLSGRILWVCEPTRGSTHDARAIKATGILEYFKDTPPLADRGYEGLGLITPDKKTQGAELKVDQKKANKVINSLRAAVERAIAHLKTWRILDIPYRRPFHTFTQTITTAVALQFYKQAFE